MAETLPIHHSIRVRADLSDLSLDVTLELRSPWTVLFGPSGSGKSSLLRALGGLMPKAAVRFQRGTTELSALPPQRRALSYAPQSPSLFPHMSVMQNVRFSMEAHGNPPRKSTLADDAASIFRLHALRDRRPQELSGGEQKRVSLARAYAQPGAALLLLDEPFAGFDRGLRNELLPELLSGLSKRQLPVLSVTHDVDEAVLLNADVVRIESGKVIAQGPALEVLALEREQMLTSLGQPGA
ncbi:MAG: ATP-binding cassette domain-containing protein [Acidobacteriaceae bacterium]|nr:ATP-binding cassette domain-containing protein [Acidobacteriaceae bacterium]